MQMRRNRARVGLTIRGTDNMGAVFGGMFLPVLLSLIGPIYYGITGGPPWRIAVWATASLAGFLWIWRRLLAGHLAGLSGADATKAFLAIVIVSGAFFMIGDYAVYFVARLISN